MNKISKTVITVLMFAIILLGTKEYASLNWFIKPVAWQILYGYSNNEVPADAGINEKIKSVTAKIESIFADTEQKYTYITINGLVHKIMGKNIVNDADASNTVYKLKNGHLTFTNPKVDTEDTAKQIIKLKKFTDTAGCDLIYIQAPYKISKYNPMLPVGVEDYTNENADTFLEALKENNVDCLDLREEMYKQGIDSYDYFFKTDHHWTPEGGFWANKTITKYLSDKYDFDIDEKILDINNYSIEIHENLFLGALGRRVGKYYNGMDDFAVIKPKFETELSVYSLNKDIDISGDFEQIFLDYSKLEQGNIFTSDPYSFYAKKNGGNIIKNHQSPNNQKILLVRDSFSAVVSPFLSLNCAELKIIDLRGDHSLALTDYILQYNPDIVMIMYNPNMVGDNTMFNFGI